MLQVVNTEDSASSYSGLVQMFRSRTIAGLLRHRLGLTALLFAVVVFANLVPSIVSHPANDQGCYCHNLGVSIYVNSTDVNLYKVVNIPYVSVQKGKSFTLLVRTEDISKFGVAQPLQAWWSNRTDNDLFKFDPQQVGDNSPRDQDPTVGNIVAFYKVTAPTVPGSYELTLYAQWNFVPVYVTVTNTFDVTISLVGLPTNLSTALRVDGNKAADMKSSSVNVLTYPGETSHSFEVDQYVDGVAGYRYICASNSLTTSDTASKVFNYTTQVYLDVSTEPTGVIATVSGWFALNSSASISPVPAEVHGARGIKYEFAGWTVDGAPRTGNGFVLRMDVPHKVVAKFQTVTAVWATSYFELYMVDVVYIVVGVAAAIAVAVIALLWRRREKSSTTIHAADTNE